MQVIADLQLHSKYARAVSQNMVVPVIAEWAAKKGIGLVATGDWTHPLWFRELEAGLEEAGEGVFAPAGARRDSLRSHHPSPFFLLSTEVSCIYSQGGKTRRIHILIFAPSFETVRKINQEFLRRGANLLSDGRPIMGLSARNVAELVLSVDEHCLLIPAHCLPPDSYVHTKDGVRQIGQIKVNDLVYTHNNKAEKVTKILKRNFEGNLYHIRPWYFAIGTKTTPEHPFYAFKVAYCPSTGDRCLPTMAHKRVCTHKFYKGYKPSWIPAEKLEVGDVLVFPRFQNTTMIPTVSLTEFSSQLSENKVLTGGSRGRIFAQDIVIDQSFCRLAGYYLAEGYTNGRDEIGFTFHQGEKEYIKDVISLMDRVFGISHHRLYRRNGGKSIEISFYSKLLVDFFKKLFYAHTPYRATTKMVPDWMLHLQPELQAELLRGWWRGDKGYTSSRQLMNGMKVLCLRLGIIPSILQDTQESHLRRGNHQYHGRVIKASGDSHVFSLLSFFEDPYNLLTDPAFKKSVRKLERKHGWIDKEYIYIPIRRITREYYQGEVVNLEVEKDNSYLTEFATIHNCWTPWFSLYGSMSGFDSIEECFGEYAKYIYAVETGLSSDPAMNWRIAELEGRQIVSFSDAHSPAKLGREATVFELSEVSYDAVRKAITGKYHENQGYHGYHGEENARGTRDTSNSRGTSSIAYTIEFYPEEGKYHFTGHRNCGVRQTPGETKLRGTTCHVCGKPLTIGVMHRVEDLANGEIEVSISEDDYGVRWIHPKEKNRPKYVMMVPLAEILSEALEVGVSSQKVANEYEKLTNVLGPEFEILLQTKAEEIERISGSKVREAVEKVRSGDIFIDPGYDGVFGKVKIWQGDEKDKLRASTDQIGLF